MIVLTRFLTVALILSLWSVTATKADSDTRRPNILIAISDDQSWQHTSAAGYRAVSTPAFDRVGSMGVRCTQCIAGSPGCSPSRAALLTGLQHWQLEEAGTHASSFPQKFVTFPDRLEQSGYVVGYTGKGWGPGDWKDSGRLRNPAGTAFNENVLASPEPGINSNDYTANFAAFLKSRPAGQPFCFWYGGHEPHRVYQGQPARYTPERLANAAVPSFLPDVPEVRRDLIDYCHEIEWFDQHLGQMLMMLETAGELDNTLVIVTADNGMSFPRAKANLYEYGIHVPLAICWPKRIPGGRVIDDLAGFVDLTATIVEAAGISDTSSVSSEASNSSGASTIPPAGRSLMSVLSSDRQGIVDPSRDMVFSGRERHSSSRPQNLGYPCRALRTHDYLYIRNFHPERWPAGDPQDYPSPGVLGPLHGAYRDIDAGPTLKLLTSHADQAPYSEFLSLAVAKRPTEELYDIRADPGCVKNLAAVVEHQTTLSTLRSALTDYLTQTNDSRMGTQPEVWETYKRYSALREFPPSP
jgi:N-sulfoglucosamine sulfohydrolase